MNTSPVIIKGTLTNFDETFQELIKKFPMNRNLLKQEKLRKYYQKSKRIDMTKTQLQKIKELDAFLKMNGIIVSNIFEHKHLLEK